MVFKSRLKFFFFIFFQVLIDALLKNYFDSIGKLIKDELGSVKSEVNQINSSLSSIEKYIKSIKNVSGPSQINNSSLTNPSENKESGENSDNSGSDNSGLDKLKNDIGGSEKK